jgi:predicted nucleic acid-binding protein
VSAIVVDASVGLKWFVPEVHAAELPLTRHPEPPLLTSAFDLADRTQRTVYDCLYLALAVQLNGRMVTADQRLYNSLAQSPWAGFVVWVGDLPAVGTSHP